MRGQKFFDKVLSAARQVTVSRHPGAERRDESSLESLFDTMVEVQLQPFYARIDELKYGVDAACERLEAHVRDKMNEVAAARERLEAVRDKKNEVAEHVRANSVQNSIQSDVPISPTNAHSESTSAVGHEEYEGHEDGDTMDKPCF
jgi:hypothetical protein